MGGYNPEKEERARAAREHTEKMRETYKREIKKAVEGTKVYNPGFRSGKDAKKEQMKVAVKNLDTVSAAEKYRHGKTAILNFASYRNPGGMFLAGSRAQEECLCHASFLYNVLTGFKEYYAWNGQHRNRSLYFDRALYTQDVLFFGSKPFFLDVITCAAPNKSAAQKYHDVSGMENREALEGRIRFVLDIAKENEVETLVLGAYGCGVFGQDPMEVARIFGKYLNTTHRCFGKVLFAVPDGKDGNYRAFCEALGSGGE